MYTLWNCRNLIHEDFLLLESDLVFESKAITSLLECSYESAMLITPVTKFQDQYYVEMDVQHVLTNCSTDPTTLNYSGELVGIHKVSHIFYECMCREYGKIVEAQPKLGYEYQLLYMSKHIMPMHVLLVEGLQWYEIDDERDMKFAEKNIRI
jgi:choline kinase